MKTALRSQLPRILVIILFFVLSIPVTPLFAQGALDDCNDSALIGLGVTMYDTTLATTDGPEPCAQLGSDIWFRFIAQNTTNYEISLCAGTTYDAALAIYPGMIACPPTATDAIACDDDGCTGAATLNSIVTINLSAGQEILIQVGGYDGAIGSGEITLTELAAPSGPDQCANAEEIFEGATAFETLTSTTDGPQACAQIGSDIWFTFTAPSDGSWRISLCAGTNYDAALAVYPGSVSCPPTDNDVLACNDDGCFGAGPPIVIVSLNSGEQILLQVGGWSSAAGIGEIVIDDVPPLPAGADILVGEISNFVQFGRLADEIGCGIESVTCNAGAEPLDWFGNPDPRHPFITTAAYRLENGRLYQIGMSWAKHGFAAAQTDACNLGCTAFPNGTRLGSGCSDIYGASTNASQQFLGPRSEINPWTGAYDFSTSLLSSTSGPYDPVERRLRIQDRDVDPTMHPGAEYFCEVLVLAHDDVDHLNSVAWQPISVSPMSPSGVFTFDTSATSTLGPAIFAWPDATIVEVLEPTAQDGRVFVGHRVIELGNDHWRYEYAIQNLDLNSGIGAFEIPVPAGVTVSHMEFHAPNQHEPSFADESWQGTRLPDSVRWETDPISSPTLTNPIRWGALYNFSFTANSAPVSETAILETYDPSILSSMNAEVASPLAPPLVESFRRGDINADGLYDVADVIAGLQCLFLCFPACFDAHDVNDDGLWNIADPIYNLDYLFSNGPSLAAPFPGCGEDLTADALDCQSYLCP